jgi:hypothetical protein
LWIDQKNLQQHGYRLSICGCWLSPHWCRSANRNFLFLISYSKLLLTFLSEFFELQRRWKQHSTTTTPTCLWRLFLIVWPSFALHLQSIKTGVRFVITFSAVQLPHKVSHSGILQLQSLCISAAVLCQSVTPVFFSCRMSAFSKVSLWQKAADNFVTLFQVIHLKIPSFCK